MLLNAVVSTAQGAAQSATVFPELNELLLALFEAFRFRWGKGFSTPDPMHFEYAG